MFSACTFTEARMNFSRWPHQEARVTCRDESEQWWKIVNLHLCIKLSIYLSTRRSPSLAQKQKKQKPKQTLAEWSISSFWWSVIALEHRFSSLLSSLTELWCGTVDIINFIVSCSVCPPFPALCHSWLLTICGRKSSFYTHTHFMLCCCDCDRNQRLLMIRSKQDYWPPISISFETN